MAGATASSTLVVKRSRPAADVPLDDLRESWLVERNLQPLERVDPRGIEIRARHVVAEVGEAGAAHKPDIAGTDNCDFHKTLFTRGTAAPPSAGRRPARARSTR